MFKWMSIISDFRNSSSSTITNKKKIVSRLVNTYN